MKTLVIDYDADTGNVELTESNTLFFAVHVGDIPAFTKLKNAAKLSYDAGYQAGLGEAARRIVSTFTDEMKAEYERRMEESLCQTKES